MSSKIFSSPGVSSRPLNVFERLREWHHYRPHPSQNPLRRLKWWVQHRIWRWKNRHWIRAFEKSLSSGSYNLTPSTAGQPLRVESLQATMRVVTFDSKDLKL